MRRKLIDEEHSPAAAQHAVDELTKLRVVDDAAFARAFASHKLRTAHWGRSRLRSALMQRLVAPEDADAALQALFATGTGLEEDRDADVDVLSPEERHDALLDAARKHWRASGRGGGGTSVDGRKRRLAGWLARRGHDFRTVDGIVRQVAGEEAPGHDAEQWE